jgi:Heterokaryon incompatibility protein (HET)
VRLEIIDAALPSKDLGIKNTCVQYLALSYVWGKSDDNNPEILINEKLFRVTPNLEKALIHLEHEVKLPIWIDAICINQKDLREREDKWHR